MKRKGWCPTADKACPTPCPVPSVDNFGGRYPGCALMRIKTKAEMAAMTGDGQGEKEG